MGQSFSRRAGIAIEEHGVVAGVQASVPVVGEDNAGLVRIGVGWEGDLDLIVDDVEIGVGCYDLK